MRFYFPDVSNIPTDKAFYMHSEQVAIHFDVPHERILQWASNELPASMRDMVLTDASGKGLNIDCDLIFPRDGVLH